MQPLKENDFIDLYIGEDYAEIKGLKGAGAFLSAVPDDLADDVETLRQICIQRFHDSGSTEFWLC